MELFILHRRKLKPCSEQQFEKFWRLKRHRIRHSILGKTHISTVFLGMEHPGNNFYETAIITENDIKVAARARNYKAALHAHRQVKNHIKQKDERMYGRANRNTKTTG